MRRLFLAARRATWAATAWHLATAVIAVAALVTQLVLTVRGTNVLVTTGPPPSAATRVIRFFSYFTVQSNILVAFVAASLVGRPARDGRAWRVVRLSALFGIAVTGIIYATLLRPLVDLHGVAALTDVAFHYLAPLLGVVGWLLFGPWPRVDEPTLLWSLVWPVAYVAYTILHGAATDWYPYPFIDAKALGYVPALRNGAGIAVLLLGVGTLFMLADRRLGALAARAAPVAPVAPAQPKP